jgi:sulfite oxidase
LATSRSAGKVSGFRVLRTAPFNGGPPLNVLCERRVTPVASHFVRSHGPVPRIDSAAYALEVRGLVEVPRRYTLDELKRNFPHARSETVIECAGNRRKELNAVEHVFGEIPWGPEAVGNALWGGLSLRQLLIHAGVKRSARHVAFIGLDEAKMGGAQTAFGGSIPLRDAMRGGVMLAYEMNRSPLTPNHGAPLRAVVPGFIGARSVKWLGAIELLSAPSTNPFQSRTYKIVPRGATAAQWARAKPLGPTRVNCAICVPQDGARVRGASLTVRGYAHGEQGRPVARVEVSADGGKTWAKARLPVQNPSNGWVLWSARVQVPQGPAEIVARCTDAAGGRQPASLKSAWNAGGYANNAWHRVKITSAYRQSKAPRRTHS